MDAKRREQLFFGNIFLLNQYIPDASAFILSEASGFGQSMAEAAAGNAGRIALAAAGLTIMGAELFLVLKGTLAILLRDRTVHLEPGELFVVPRGVEHKPVAECEAQVLLLEPASTVNTGDVRNQRTVESPEYI